MQENTLPSLLPKASRTPFYLSLFFLIAMTTATIALFVMSHISASKMTSTEASIATKNTEMTELKKDKRIIITNILKSGTVQPSLDLKRIVASFRSAAGTANVRLKGFSITKDTISTMLTATQPDLSLGEGAHPDSVSTIISMMRAYDAPGGTRDFRLEPIRSVDGTFDARTTSLQFRIINP